MLKPGIEFKISLVFLPLKRKSDSDGLYGISISFVLELFRAVQRCEAFRVLVVEGVAAADGEEVEAFEEAAGDDSAAFDLPLLLLVELLLLAIYLLPAVDRLGLS